MAQNVAKKMSASLSKDCLWNFFMVYANNPKTQSCGTAQVEDSNINTFLGDKMPKHFPCD